MQSVNSSGVSPDLSNNTNVPSSSNNQTAFSSSYPIPPMQYVNLFTDENIAKGKNPNPPKLLIEGSYSMFGVAMMNDEAIIRPLESQGIKRLYPRDYDHKRELKKMNASILVNFLDLLDVLVKCPDTSKREEKCSDIAMLFVQMHHLINELRPHQGRETIRVTLQCQKRQRLEIIARLNKQIERVGELILNSVNNIPEININGLEEFNLPNNLKENKEIKIFDDSITKNIYLQANNLDSIMCNIIDEI